MKNKKLFKKDFLMDKVLPILIAITLIVVIVLFLPPIIQLLIK